MAWAVGAYEGALRRALVDYKYRGVVGWAPVLGRLVATWLEGNATAVEELDVLVPVPAYAGPGARRRFDAVGRIAAEAAAATGGAWAVAPGALVKTAETPPLARRAAPGRRVAAEGALRASLSVADAGAVAGARVLVVDDVMSTGSTLREVARVLRAAGADEVAALVVARAGLLAPFSSARAPGP
ncbi:MAG TPA: phosphoribosyltransferase family protein [Acidimicrobiales bacterium]|nr:phosphoribosyltransferase family protein [Acidimicrobiales bacterium]